MPVIELKNISNFICRDISLKIANGELMVLLGPTGAGKTTLLNIVSGLIEYEGSILFDGVSIDEIPVNRRSVGYLLQDLALFPHLDVVSNITYGLKIQKRRVNEIKARLDEMLDLMNIPDLARRYPKDLSGGEKQRVALARALAPSPQVLLLDEPMSNLDPLTKETILDEFKSIQRKTGITTIYVTHDQNEALSLGDRISVLNEGKIEQVGVPDELFYHPETEFVARFVGFKNILKVSIVEIKQHEAVVYINNECIDQPFKIRVKRYPVFEKGKEISLCIHPERIILKRVNGSVDSNLNRMMGKIVDRRRNGKNIRATIDIGGSEVHAAIPKALFDFKIHEDVWACFAPDAPHPLCGKRCGVTEDQRRCP
ncbi:MAG: ABC transporter ATP-binding protein [Thermodesulfobacteriota bacterium]|nr:ABC transporter ATP-binding protein [Thermodesulfobacteriota bacterium]